MHNLPLRSCLTHLTESLVPQLLRVHHACPACRRRHRHKAAASVHAHSQVGLRTLPQSFGQVLVSPDSPASSVEEAEGLVRRRGKEFVQQLQKRVSDELPRLPFSRCVWARAGVRVYLCARAHVCVCMRVCVCICVLKCMRMCVRVCEQGCRAVADHPTHLSPTPEAPASTASALSRRPCWGHQAVGACSCPHGAQPVWLGQLGGGCGAVHLQAPGGLGVQCLAFVSKEGLQGRPPRKGCAPSQGLLPWPCLRQQAGYRLQDHGWGTGRHPLNCLAGPRGRSGTVLPLPWLPPRFAAVRQRRRRRWTRRRRALCALLSRGVTWRHSSWQAAATLPRLQVCACVFVLWAVHACMRPRVSPRQLDFSWFTSL